MKATNSAYFSTQRLVNCSNVLLICHNRNKDEITRDTLSDVDLIVFGASREEFSAHEASELTNWLNGGGRILMCFTDGAEIDENLNLKNFLKT